MNILVTSVPHSATNFFHQLLKPAHICHVHSDRIEYCLKTAETVTCALRQPEEVWASWWHRREGLNHPANDAPGALWFEVWERLEWVTRQRGDIFFLPIDHPERERRLAALGERLGQRFEPDWSVKQNECLRDRGPPPAIDLEHAYRIPIVGELYGQAA